MILYKKRRKPSTGKRQGAFPRANNGQDALASLPLETSPMKPIQEILIVGGGTAGWLTAAFLARTLGTAQGGVRVTLVESSDIGIIGVGEGTFPSIRGTLNAIGLDEARFVAECDATFKQGVNFV